MGSASCCQLCWCHSEYALLGKVAIWKKKVGLLDVGRAQSCVGGVTVHVDFCCAIHLDP